MAHSTRWGVVSALAALGMAAWRDMGAYPDAYAAALFVEQAGIVALLVGAALWDIRARVIPNGAALGVVVLHVAGMAVQSALRDVGLPWLIGRSLLGAAAIGGGVLALALALERLRGAPALGGGDVKLLFALGFAFGWERGTAILLLACAAFILAVGLAGAARGVRARLGTAGSRMARPGGVAIAPDTAHPFAPALAVGSYLALLAL